MANQINIQIKDRIRTKLEEIDEIQEVHDKPVHEFGGKPAATITPAGIERQEDFDENAFDGRAYLFNINLYYPFDREDLNSIGYAIDTLYDLADRVMDKFTQDKVWESPTSFQDGMASGYTFLGLDPVTGEYDQDDQRQMIIVPINLRCRFLIPNINCN